jgi:DNA-binding beta-propeller fold protein YncE
VVEDGQLQDFAGRQRDHGFSGDGGLAMDAQFHATVGQTAGPANKIDVGPDAVYIADTNNHVIRRIDRDTAIIDTVAGIRTCGALGECAGEDVQGGAAGPADEVGLRYPVDVALGPDGALYIADTMNHCVRVIRDGWTETFAGTCGEEGYEGDNGPADSALLSRPEGVMVDGAGHVYIADTYNHVIRVVYPNVP